MKKKPVKPLQAKTETQLLEEKAPLLDELTPRQSQILSFIVAHITAHGCAPTIRELCRDTGIASLNGVVDHLKALHRKGWIRHTKPGTARSYTLSAAAVGLVPELVRNEVALTGASARLDTLSEFIRDFPDNVSSKLEKCRTPLQGALLIANLVDDILCGDYES